MAKHAHVGVRTDQGGIHDAIQSDAIDNIGTRTADADDADAWRAVLGAFG
jgi:hypothetical protein